MRNRMVAGVLGAMLACAVILQPLRPALAAKADGVDWTTGVITVVGSGVFPAGRPAAQARLMARRAAQADAYRQLAEAIQGVQVTSETVVKNFETESDEIRTQVSALVKGARITDENVTADGAYEVRIELPIFGAGSLASVVFESSLIKRKSGAGGVGAGSPPMPAEASPTGPHALSGISGLVVDARGLGAKAAMMPALFDEVGKELYMGAIQVSNEDLVAAGPVSYVKSLEEAKKHQRIGANPLVVRAKRYKGPFHADLVVVDDDAKRVQQAGPASDFLKRLAVVIVL